MLATPQAFAYDAVGNRTTGGAVVNAGNQLTADANYAYIYDDNGNLTRKTLLATGSFTQYTYDPENRLTKVEDFTVGNPTPAFTSMYRYDGLGRRIEKVANGQTKRLDRERGESAHSGSESLCNPPPIEVMRDGPTARLRHECFESDDLALDPSGFEWDEDLAWRYRLLTTHRLGVPV